jgi:cytochrome oxidase Cu insertion factor (SCO1/SenC/PrrC family)
VTIKFDIEDKLVNVTVDPEENSILYVVNSYVNNFNDTRQGIIVRRKGSEETFKVTYECVMK